MPERMINAHLDTGCSDTGPSAASSSNLAKTPHDHVRNTKSAKSSGNAKATGIHPLFQKPNRDPARSEPSTFATPTQSKKRNAGEAVQLMNTPPAAGPSKRQKISTNVSQAAPLAERLRPRLLAEYVGQAHLTEAGSMLMNSLANGSLGSMIFWGPPGYIFSPLSSVDLLNEQQLRKNDISQIGCQTEWLHIQRTQRNHSWDQ